MPPRHFRMALRHPQMHPSHQHWFTQFWGLSSIGTFLFTRLLYAILSYIYFLPKPSNLVPMVSSLASNALGSTSTVQPLASTNLQSRRASRSLAKTGLWILASLSSGMATFGPLGGPHLGLHFGAHLGPHLGLILEPILASSWGSGRLEIL